MCQIEVTRRLLLNKFEYMNVTVLAKRNFENWYLIKDSWSSCEVSLDGQYSRALYIQNMTHSQMFQKVEYGWGLIFKVVLEC